MGVNLKGSATPNPGAPGGILQAIHDGIGGIGDALAGGLNDIITGIIQMVTGNYEGSWQPFLDGQFALNERFDLLGQSGYCPTVMKSNFRLGPSRNRALPFDTVAGPHQGAELVQVTRTHPGAGSAARTEWAIRLDRAGLWQANASFSHGGDGMGDSYAEIVVLRPDLTVYSSTAIPQAQQVSSLTAPRGGAPVNLFKMFVVDEPGYYVQVRWWWASPLGIRTARGGAAFSQFAVTQWSEEISGVVNDGPDGTIDDGSPVDP